MKRALVTGANGFIGRAVVARLQAEGWDVVSAVRRPPEIASPDILVLGPAAWDMAVFADAIRQAEPDVIFHLAGKTVAAHSAELYSANICLTASLLDAVAASPARPAVVLAGSAAEYGNLAADHLPAREDGPCRPVSDYGISKFTQTLLGLSRAKAGIRVLIGRIFNSIGAGMPSHLALASFAAQIRGGAAHLSVGNLDVARDFIDVADVARLLVSLASDERNYGRVYNICSGVAVNLRSVVEELVRLSGRPLRLLVDPGRLRTVDLPRFLGDTTRLGDAGQITREPDFAALLPALLAG